MTVSSTTNRVSFTGNGSTTAFSFPHYFQSTSDLVVVLKVISTGAETVQTITTHYTVSGTQVNNVFPNGGTVTMLTAPTALQQLIIYREPAFTQTVDLVENDPLPAETLEQALDKRTMVEQRLDDRLDRTVRQREAYTGSLDPQLPAVDVPDGVLQIKSDGTGFQWAEFDQGSLTDHLADTTDAHTASAITNVASGNLASTDVQSALNELQTDIDTGATNLSNHLADTTDAHDASAISNVPAGNLAATDVQTALDELQTDIDTRATTAALNDHLNDTVDAHDASAISNVPAGNLAATDVQTALDELQSDIDTRATTTALNDHLNDATDAHDASAISNVPSGNLAATEVQAALNELQTDIDGRQAGPLTGDVTTPSASNAAATIANDAVTYAKMQNVSAASKLLGRGSAGGSGDVEEITLGSGLTMTGTTLSSSGGGGSWTRISASTLTRVTGSAPTALGEYRSYIRGASTFTWSETNGAPNTAPTSADGFLIYATGNGAGHTTADPNGEPSKYEIFIGANKVFKIEAYATTGRSGTVSIDHHYISNTFLRGLAKHYNPNTGILTLVQMYEPSSITSTACGVSTDNGGNSVADVFFDVLYQ